MCLFVFRSTSYYQVKQRLLYKIKTLFQFLPSLLDIVKPFVAAIKTIKNQEQYASSYIKYVLMQTQCSSQSAPLGESRKRSRDGPHQKRSRAIMALSFFNSLGLKMSLLLQLQ